MQGGVSVNYGASTGVDRPEGYFDALTNGIQAAASDVSILNGRLTAICDRIYGTQPEQQGTVVKDRLTSVPNGTLEAAREANSLLHDKLLQTRGIIERLEAL